MEQQILITMTPDDLLNLIKTGFREVEKEKINNDLKNTSFSINGAAKELGRSFTTIKKLICEGKLKTIESGKRITAQELNNYLRSI